MFTPREEEVLELVILGLTNKEIAENLVISYSTAKVHISNIMKKINARSRIEVVTISLLNEYVDTQKIKSMLTKK